MEASGAATGRRLMHELTRSLKEAEMTMDTLYLRPMPGQDGDASEGQQSDALSVDTSVKEAEIDSAAGLASPVPTVGKHVGYQPPWVAAINKWLDKHTLTVQQVILRDKLTFMLGLMNVMLSSLLFGYPTAFVRFFGIKSAVLLSSRWVCYRLKNWHWYLMEFCYVCIAIGVVHTSFFPLNPLLYKLTFALFAGVLTPAVVATNNAFVLHSIDKITSLFQHLTPSLVAWLLRWQAPHAVPGWDQLTSEQQAAMSKASFVELTLAPMGVWAVWALVYYALVFTLADNKIRQRGYANMFTLQTKSKKAATTRFILSFKARPMQYAAYLGIHGSCCLIGCLLNNLWWHSRAAHSLLMMCVMMVSLYNGASYYFDVFAIKYKMLVEQEQAGLRPKDE